MVPPQGLVLLAAYGETHNSLDPSKQRVARGRVQTCSQAKLEVQTIAQIILFAYEPALPRLQSRRLAPAIPANRLLRANGCDVAGGAVPGAQRPCRRK